jgi:GNAT superfamily N-acetyltransferase
VHRYLAEESYWARGREYADVEEMVSEAARVVGLYHDRRQIGFCRAARCAPGLFYLADVYVLDEYRGRGLGVELVREMIDGEPLAGRKWLLHTEDAHDLYKRFGFAEPNYKLMERPAPSE